MEFFFFIIHQGNMFLSLIGNRKKTVKISDSTPPNSVRYKIVDKLLHSIKGLVT